MHLIIITPIFPPASGGAATYYQVLSRGLLEASLVREVTVITECFPGEPSRSVDCGGKRRVIRLFPHRAGGALSKLNQGIRYCIQNLQYRRLPALITSLEGDAVLVHSSLQNFANLFDPIVKRLRDKVLLIADVRCHQMPAAKVARRLKHYHRIIACSENVEAHLTRQGPLGGRLVTIPVPQESLGIEDTRENRQIVTSAGLQPGRYMLFAGLIKRRKGIELLLDAYQSYLQNELESLDLALVGQGKDATLLRRARHLSGVHVLGSVDRFRLLVLMKFAALNVNLSFSEGMPRVCLEALALGTRVILPAGVPEFRRFCAPWVAASDHDPDVLARQFSELLKGLPASGYPLERHDIARTLPLYAELLSVGRSRAGTDPTFRPPLLDSSDRSANE
jgi:glycosyltransferase involved in cell wall biosynthesis